MRYFIDTEFLEGTQKTLFGNTKPTIDLISIGIVSEDNREYYAISKEFNLKEAWNRFDWKEHKSIHKEDEDKKLYRKIYWIRENILKPLMQDAEYRWNFPSKLNNKFKGKFDYKDFVYIINKYGKTNKQIAEEIKIFTKTCTKDQLEYKGCIDNWYTWQFRYSDIKWEVENCNEYNTKEKAYQKILEVTNNAEPDKPQFYGYYSDYDWVVFCWLFGKMIDLPKGFPMYCIDLKQTLDELQEFEISSYNHELNCNGITISPLKIIKELPNYPKQVNEHNALLDAKFCRDLYYFLNSLNDRSQILFK